MICGPVSHYYEYMVSVHALLDKQQTGNEMARLVRSYSTDLGAFRTQDGTPLLSLSLYEFYTMIRDIPYQEDRTGVEIVTRPWHILAAEWPGLDCKKKNLLIASWLEQHRIPWRFVAVSSRQDREIHHVIVEAKIDGSWVEIDATYPHNQLGQVRTWTNRELLSGSRGRWAHSPILVSMYGEGEPGQATDQQFDNVRGRLRSATMGVEPASTAGTVVGIIVAIVMACASVAGIIIGAVQSSRQEDRAHAFAAQQAKDAQDFARELQERAAAEAAAKREKDEELLMKVAIPASVGIGGLMLVTAKRRAA